MLLPVQELHREDPGAAAFKAAVNSVTWIRIREVIGRCMSWIREGREVWIREGREVLEGHEVWSAAHPDGSVIGLRTVVRGRGRRDRGSYP